MRVDGLLERAQLEPRTSDHANTITGCIWFRTDTSQVKVATGSGYITLFSGNVDDSTVEINAGVLRVKDGGITKAKQAAVGQQISSDSSIFSSNSTTYVDVTNLTVTITTTGRPVFIFLQPSTATSPGFGMEFSGSVATVHWKLVRGVTDLAEFAHESEVTGAPGSPLNRFVPPGCIQYLDTPAAGTYTYKIQVKTFSALTYAQAWGVKLVAFEL